MTTVLERGVYVTIGAADLVVEKVREVPGLERLRQRSWIESLRDFEPKVRKQGEELQVRGEQVLKRVRTRTDELRKRAESLPGDARKQVQEFPRQARKQVDELRTDAGKQVKEIQTRIEKAWSQLSRNGNGASAKTRKQAGNGGSSAKTA